MPGVTAIDRESPVATSPVVDTGASFIANPTEKGPVGVPVFCRNLAQYEAVFGGPVAGSYAHDAARLIPVDGGSGQWFVRAVGPNPVKASATFTDGSSNTIKAEGINPGAWSNSLAVKFVPSGGNFTVVVKLNGTIVQEIGPVATVAAAVTAAETSPYIRLVALGVNDPVEVEKTLTGGTDDIGNITITQKKAALAAFTRDLGPGQVAYPGDTTKELRTALAEHALANNRAAIPDGADTHTVATHTAAKAELSGLSKALKRASAQPFLPWVKVDGETAGTTKTIPPSILVMAAISRHDSETFNSAIGINNPNSPAAGVNGILESATGLSQEAWPDAEMETLNESGGNVIRVVNGQVIVYGYRTLADATDEVGLYLNNRRLDMAILARAEAIGAEFVFSQVDARGHILGEFAGALRGMLGKYVQIEALFDTDESPGFSVDVSEQVNPPDQLAEGKIRAVISARRSPLAERVEIEYFKEAVA